LLYPTQGSSTAESAEAEKDTDKITKVAQPNINLGQSQNAAINQMAQELIEFRKGNSKQADELLRLQDEKDQLGAQNIQIHQ